MPAKSILIVDDEKNIRLTMLQSLEPMGMVVQAAVNGEEAIEKLKEDRFGIVFLDLKMPGMDGIEILRQIKEKWPETRVIIITAHGTIDIAVEAMKLGAVDFITKPFSPKEIRELVDRVLKREELNESTAVDYQDLIELTRQYMNAGDFKAARVSARKAIALDPGKPDAYNLLGGLLESGRDRLEAQKFYRAALDIDPTYKPALDNLERATSRQRYGKINFGLDKEKSPSKIGNN
jgi:DNA-binding response OmpR family regulator